MKLNTGRLTIPIEFDNGDKEYIYAYPSDPKFIKQMREFANNAAQRAEEFDNISVDGSGKTDKQDEIEKAEQIIREELNKVFAQDVSSIIFKYCSPFAIVDGEFFVIAFIQELSALLIEHAQKNTNDIANSAAYKHVERYL